MKNLSVIPMPDKYEFLNGEAEINCEKLVCRIDSSLQKEEYILTLSQDEFTLTGGSENAIFYGKQTVRQLGSKHPCVRIHDKPAYSYRGFHIDTARHIFTVDELKKFIDAAANLKMNTMHWHLTDDQGFRMEVSRRPELAEKGSVRKKSNFGSLKEYGPYGGYFTTAQMKEIVAYCAEKFITVIPEFDIPGHSSALLHVHPELTCSGNPVEIKSRQGIFKDIFCAGKEETFEMIFAVLEELLEIFPSEYIHIGGDEAPKDNWKNCPDCQKRIRENGLRNEEELQGWFTNRIVEFLESKGRKALVWNESLKSGLISNSVTVQQWMDRKNLSVDFANKGGKIIVSDFFHYYCDYPYSMTPLSKTYNFSPILKGIRRPENIIGVEGALWTEYINNFDRLCYMAFPRYAAIAESGWTKEENKNLADFKNRFASYSKFLSGIGINSAPLEESCPSPAKRISKTVQFFWNNYVTK